MGLETALLVGAGALAGAGASKIIAGGSKPKTAAQPTPATPTQTADDVARETERRRLLNRGLSPLAATSPAGDVSAANLGRKALLGQ